jgi:hypothetical protein
MIDLIVRIVIGFIGILLVFILAFLIFLTYKEIEAGNMHKHFNSVYLADKEF